MNCLARDAYLENEILTATPQRLRLMLIEGAIRFARQALLHWEQGVPDQATAALGRARSIAGELLASIQPESSPLCRKVAGLYLFLFRAFAEAPLDHNVQRIQDAIEVLEIERETWRLLCQQNAARVTDDRAGAPATYDPANSQPPAAIPIPYDSPAAGGYRTSSSLPGGLSFEA